MILVSLLFLALTHPDIKIMYALHFIPLFRKSHCGGKGMWWGRACLIRQPSPLRGTRARLLQRAQWKRLQRRKAGRVPALQSPLTRLTRVCVGVVEVPVDCTTSGGAAVVFVGAAGKGRKKGGRLTVNSMWTMKKNSLHEAFKVASGCWSCPSSLMHFFSPSSWESN